MDTLIRDLFFAVIFGAVGYILFMAVSLLYWRHHHRKNKKDERD